MAIAKDRALNRQKRKEGRRSNHEPLLQLIQEEEGRRTSRAKPKELKPLTQTQTVYDQEISSKLITFGIGPAGTGKTWWAAMRAGLALKSGEIDSIIVTRPAIEAGEKLGFLPGELEDKYEPYFRPVKDALKEALGAGPLEYHLKAGSIEARPLALLRGATLKNCWVIADEMQNATRTQMKLLLTRFGEDARMIINGDPSQCDLPSEGQSGLMDAVGRLERNPRIGVVRFTVADIVRHGLVQEIIEAYSDDALPELPAFLKAS